MVEVATAVRPLRMTSSSYSTAATRQSALPVGQCSTQARREQAGRRPISLEQLRPGNTIWFRKEPAGQEQLTYRYLIQRAPSTCQPQRVKWHWLIQPPL